MGSISGVFIITYKGKVVLPPIPVVGHVDGVPVASWQGVEVEDVEVAADDGDAEVAEDGADKVHVYAEAAEHRDKKYKKRWGSSLQVCVNASATSASSTCLLACMRFLF